MQSGCWTLRHVFFSKNNANKTIMIIIKSKINSSHFFFLFPSSRILHPVRYAVYGDHQSVVKNFLFFAA